MRGERTRRARRTAYLALAVAIATWGGPVAAAAQEAAAKASPNESWFDPEEMSLRLAYGWSEKAGRDFDFFTFGPRLAFDLPEVIPPLLGNRIRLDVELVGSIIDDGDSTEGEFAFTPLMIDWRYDTGGFLVPFIEGGEGIVLTSLDEFSSQVGGGVHLFWSDEEAVSLGFRMRHISNAGIERPNSGLNTYFVELRIGTFPGRRRGP
jgi:hypothetical protein